MEQHDEPTHSHKRGRTEAEPERLESGELTRLVEEIARAGGTQKEKQRAFRKKYATFAEDYPTLFDMATRPDFDIEKFRYMMRLRDSVETQHISQYDASAKVGKMLYDVYVKDKVEGIPPADDSKK